MARLVFDAETNGFLHQLDTIHSLVLRDVDTEEVYSCHDYPGADYSIEQGVRMLMEADEIIGHNILQFDIPAIKKVYPWFKPKGKRTDTLLISRLIWSNIKDKDFALFRRQKLPGKLIGSHSLKAWGFRLGVFKDDFGETSDWQSWSPEMQSYCEQDVEVTYRLVELIITKRYSEEAIQLEHDFAEIIYRQIRHGFLFDIPLIVNLYAELSAIRERLSVELKGLFGEWYARNGKEKVPKKTLRYKDALRPDLTEGARYTPVKLVSFNPSSRMHIANRLKNKYGWKPKVFTDGGEPKIDESVLKSLEYPEAQQLAEYFLVEKRISQIAEGEQAWLKQVGDDGRIHGNVITNGAVTGRCTHNNPNVAQTPSVSAPYGETCRKAFRVPPGKKLVGADASGLELRCLAHFMAKWDGGAYAKEILEGDIHSANQEAAGLPTRNNAKTFIYAFLYGAGDEKIGSIVGKGRKAGKLLKKRFMDRTPAIAKLKDAVEGAAGRGYLKGLDGRRLHIRSPHAALNTLLQSAGALVMKKALIILDKLIQEQGLVPGQHYEFVANVHDEFQIEVDEEHAEMVGKLAVKSIQMAGEYFNFRCPLDGEYKVGNNWADTH